MLKFRVSRCVGVLCVVAFVAVASGCVTTSTVSFSCDERVNQGSLLTVDVLQVTDQEAQQIRGTEDWFYSQLRRELQDRRETVSVESDERGRSRVDCARELTLRKMKGFDSLAVLADYEDSGRASADDSVQILSKERWKGKSIEVRLHESSLSTRGNR